jgi:hypothetical protein
MMSSAPVTPEDSPIEAPTKAGLPFQAVSTRKDDARLTIDWGLEPKPQQAVILSVFNQTATASVRLLIPFVRYSRPK